MSEGNKLKISILDNVPIWNGSSAAQALRTTLSIAPKVEGLGYARYWVSEHHNIRRLATTAPAVLIGQIASVTRAMRVGSGAVLLSNHSPFVVAEQFGTLEALHPGRIDLGVGRSLGTDPITARLVRGGASPADLSDFAESMRDLLWYFEAGRSPSDIVAVPAHENRPPIWLLGSSVDSAISAGQLGLPYGYAHQLNPNDTVRALAAYRENFRASIYQRSPYALVSAFVITADSDIEALRLARPLIDTLTGSGPVRPGAKTSKRESARNLLETQLVGAANTVIQRANVLVTAAGADELMCVTLVQNTTDRLRSYALFAQGLLCDEVIDLDPQPPPSP